MCKCILSRRSYIDYINYQKRTRVFIRHACCAYLHSLHACISIFNNRCEKDNSRCPADILQYNYLESIAYRLRHVAAVLFLSFFVRRFLGKCVVVRSCTHARRIVHLVRSVPFVGREFDRCTRSRNAQHAMHANTHTHHTHDYIQYGSSAALRFG